MTKSSDEVIQKMASILGIKKDASMIIDISEFKKNVDLAKENKNCKDLVRLKGQSSKCGADADKAYYYANMAMNAVKCQSADDGVVSDALDKLAKVADFFDKNGFEKFANYIDKIIIKIAEEEN